VSATLLPIPSGTWARPRPDIRGDYVEAVDVIAMWVAETGHATALVRTQSGALEMEHVVSLRLTVPDRAKTLDGVLADVEVVRDMLVHAAAGSMSSRAYRELDRILEDARAGT